MNRSCGAALGALVALVGCGDQRTGLHVTAHLSAVPYDELRFGIALIGTEPFGDGGSDRVLVDPATRGRYTAPFSPGDQDVLIYLPEDLDGRAVRCVVEQLRAGMELGMGSAAATVVRHVIKDVEVFLTDPAAGGTGGSGETSGAGGDGVTTGAGAGGGGGQSGAGESGNGGAGAGTAGAAGHGDLAGTAGAGGIRGDAGAAGAGGEPEGYGGGGPAGIGAAGAQAGVGGGAGEGGISGGGGRAGAAGAGGIPGSTGAAGAAGTTGGGGAAAGAQGGPKKEMNGSSCSVATDCVSGHCVDGVCCESACDTECMSCAQLLSKGLCRPVILGTPDPRALCKDMGAASCGTNGLCDISGHCATYPIGTVCAPASCADDKGTMISPAGVCSPMGTCTQPKMMKCGPGETCVDGACAPKGLGGGP